MRVRGLTLVIFVFQLAAVAGQAHSQGPSPRGAFSGTDVWASLAPPGFNLVFEGPFTVNWNNPNHVLRASLRATNLGTLPWEITGFRWGVFDDANPLHDVIGRGWYVPVEAEAHLGLELHPLDSSEIDIFWRARAARNSAQFIKQANAMDVESRRCFVQVRLLISFTPISKTENWQAPIVHGCAF